MTDALREAPITARALIMHLRLIGENYTANNAEKALAALEAQSAVSGEATPEPAERWTDAHLRGIASDYFQNERDWPAAMLCMRHMLMEQGRERAAIGAEPPALRRALERIVAESPDSVSRGIAADALAAPTPIGADNPKGVCILGGRCMLKGDA